MNPASRRELIRRMRKLGYRGPVPGKTHAVMIRGEHRVPIPNPHGGDIAVPLLKRILREASITEAQWDSVK